MAQHRHSGTVGAHQTSVQLPLFPPLATPAVKHFHPSCIPRGQTASGLWSVADNPKLLFNFGGKSRELFHAELAQGGYLNSRGAFHSKGGSAVKRRGRKLGSGGGGQGGCWGEEGSGCRGRDSSAALPGCDSHQSLARCKDTKANDALSTTRAVSSSGGRGDVKSPGRKLAASIPQREPKAEEVLPFSAPKTSAFYEQP